VPQRILLAGLAFRKIGDIVFGTDADFQFPRAAVLDPALVPAGRGRTAESANMVRQFTGEFRALPRDTGEPGPQVVAVNALGGLAEALFAIQALGDEIVECS
jgi:hypothetical protein